MRSTTLSTEEHYLEPTEEFTQEIEGFGSTDPITEEIFRSSPRTWTG
jgi:hypothetical protein